MNIQETLNKVLNAALATIRAKELVDDSIKADVCNLLVVTGNEKMQELLLSIIDEDNPKVVADKIIKARSIYNSSLTELRTPSELPVTSGRSDLLENSESPPSVASVTDECVIVSATEQLPDVKDPEVKIKKASVHRDRLIWMGDRKKKLLSDDDIRHMTDKLVKTRNKWIEKEHKLPGIGYLVIDDAMPKIVTFEFNGQTWCFLRHLLLYLQILNRSIVAWKFNLDRDKERRMMTLFQDHNPVGSRYRQEYAIHNLDFSEIRFAGHCRTLPLLENYESPNANIKNIGKSKSLVVKIEGLTSEQKRLSPCVKIPSDDVPLTMSDYLDKLSTWVFPSNDKIFNSVKDDYDGGDVKTEGTFDHSAKSKGSTGKVIVRKTGFKVHGQTAYQKLMKFHGDDILPSDEEVISAIYNDIEIQSRHNQLIQSNSTALSEFKGIHRLHKQKEKCPISTCNKCPLIVKQIDYLMSLIDSDGKTSEQATVDVMSVHPHRNTTKHRSIKPYFTNIRQFCEWYLICLQNLRLMDNAGAEPTLQGLLLSDGLKDMVTKWYLSNTDLSPKYQKNRASAIAYIMKGTLTGFLRDRLQLDITHELIAKLEGNLCVLERHIGQISSGGETIQRNTKLKRPSDEEGKSPPYQRVVKAFYFHQNGIWRHMQRVRDSEDAHNIPQYILILAFIKLLMGPRASMLSHLAVHRNLRTIGEIATNSAVSHHTYKLKKGDSEGLQEAYAKGYALAYKKELKGKMPEGRKFELDYYVVLMSLSRAWYGYKNSGIKGMMIPFHREMSLCIFDYIASILYLRCRNEVGDKGGEYLAHRERTNHDTDTAYDYLHQNKLDLLNLCYNELGVIRLFYISCKDRKEGNLMSSDYYGAHAVYARGTYASDKWENKHEKYVLDVLRNAFRIYYSKEDRSKLDACKLIDDTDDVEDLVHNADRYTLRGTRQHTTDHIKRSCPQMPDELKELLVDHTLCHTFETHKDVYTKDSAFVRLLHFRSWVERGMPANEQKEVFARAVRDMQLLSENPCTDERMDSVKATWNEDEEEVVSTEEVGLPTKRPRLAPKPKSSSTSENDNMDVDDEEEKSKGPPKPVEDFNVIVSEGDFISNAWYHKEHNKYYLWGAFFADTKTFEIYGQKEGITTLLLTFEGKSDHREYDDELGKKGYYLHEDITAMKILFP